MAVQACYISLGRQFHFQVSQINKKQALYWVCNQSEGGGEKRKSRRVPDSDKKIYKSVLDGIGDMEGTGGGISLTRGDGWMREYCECQLMDGLII